MNVLQIALDVAIGLVGICIGEVDAIRRFTRTPKEVKHQHIWGPWELTGDVVKTYISHRAQFSNFPVQQRACLDCNKIQREAIHF